MCAIQNVPITIARDCSHYPGPSKSSLHGNADGAVSKSSRECVDINIKPGIYFLSRRTETEGKDSSDD